MKPITINAMVAGVQAGRISAFVFMFSRSFQLQAAACGCFNRYCYVTIRIQARQAEAQGKSLKRIMKKRRQGCLTPPPLAGSRHGDRSGS
jgi:hypothetical protein